MIDQDTLYWLWLASRCGPASKQFVGIIEKYDNPFDIYNLEDDEIEQLKGLTPALRAKLCDKSLDSSYEILKYCKQNKVDIIAYGDSRYPQRLKNIVDPPVLLYCKGHFPSFDSQLCIGVVGTRKMTEYGKRSGFQLSYELASAGVLTVSGMAIGIDAVAAAGALSAGACTVAVLGCGIKHTYPKVHTALMGEIIRHGAVITEYPPDEEPRGHNFPLRNRIISGLCQGVLVIEASENSGALITAKTAIAQGREVFALPGKISEAGAAGPNSLIKSGAYTALAAADIIKHYDFLWRDTVDLAATERAGDRSTAVEAALKKYGLDYASGDGSVREPVFYPPRGHKKASEAPKNEVPENKEENKEARVRREAASSATPDGSAEILASLDITVRRLFESMPKDRAVSLDEMLTTGMSVTDAVTAVTMLEVVGLISSLPGGLYIRK